MKKCEVGDCNGKWAPEHVFLANNSQTTPKSAKRSAELFTFVGKRASAGVVRSAVAAVWSEKSWKKGAPKMH